MSGKTEFVMPSAAEQLRAEEAMLRIDWDRLHAMVEAQADALIEHLVIYGPVYLPDDDGDGVDRGGWIWDPVEDGCEPYINTARALGIL